MTNAVVPLNNLLETAKAQEEKGNYDSALDIIYDSIDAAFRSGKFSQCDALLESIDPYKYSADILLALLTCTTRASDDLAKRHQFLKKVTKVLKARKEYERGLLDGLE